MQISDAFIWRRWEDEAWYPYIAPFALFMLFTFLGSTFPALTKIMYIHKTLIVGWLLWKLRDRFEELTISWNIGDWFWGVFTGLITLYIWIASENILPKMGGSSEGFNPFDDGSPILVAWLIAFIRISGASFVVPFMEELFWRSFIMRWIMEKDFFKVPLGKFTAFSFFATAVLFGLEHNRYVAGFLAGIIYGGILVWRKKLFVPILAHMVTNLGLGIYVLVTGEYTFW